MTSDERIAHIQARIDRERVRLAALRARAAFGHLNSAAEADQLDLEVAGFEELLAAEQVAIEARESDARDGTTVVADAVATMLAERDADRAAKSAAHTVFERRMRGEREKNDDGPTEDAPRGEGGGTDDPRREAQGGEEVAPEEERRSEGEEEVDEASHSGGGGTHGLRQDAGADAPPAPDVEAHDREALEHGEEEVDRTPEDDGDAEARLGREDEASASRGEEVAGDADPLGGDR
jgi:hypothetical protein